MSPLDYLHSMNVECSIIGLLDWTNISMIMIRTAWSMHSGLTCVCNFVTRLKLFQIQGFSSCVTGCHNHLLQPGLMVATTLLFLYV